MRSFLITLFMVLTKISFSQTYVSFISTADSSDQWMDYISCSNSGGNNCLEHYQNVYSITGDTSINSINYVKIKTTEKHWLTPGISGQVNCPSSINYSTYFFGGIRESSKQLYFFDPISSTEYLIYDFNLTTGDTMPNPSGFGFGGEYRIIESIDSILINNSYRKRYFLPEINGIPTTVIEGIGASTGVFHSMNINISCESNMLCYKEIGTIIYPNGINCDMNLSIEKGQLDLAIYPNPTNDYLTIESESGYSLEIEIINSFGQVILKKSVNQPSNAIDVSAISSGIYFVKVEVDGKVGLQKLIIE